MNRENSQMGFRDEVEEMTEKTNFHLSGDVSRLYTSSLTSHRDK
jgi:hypothetical protein